MGFLARGLGVYIRYPQHPPPQAHHTPQTTQLLLLFSTSEMGYSQWIILNIINSLRTQKIEVNNVNLSYGKFYAVDSKDEEISYSAISDIQILARHSRRIASCGRLNSPTGTEGSIDLYYAETKICTVYWDCPWSGHNTLDVRHPRSTTGYLCTLGNWNQGGGVVGDVDVTVFGEDPDVGVDLGVNIGG